MAKPGIGRCVIGSGAMKPLASFVLAWIFACGPVQAQDDRGKVTPLFAESNPVELTIKGPIRQIVRSAERSTEPRKARIEAAGEVHDIELSARGVSRRKRENCRFPPLRIAFPAKTGKASLFHKQSRIKLVTHCRNQGSFDQVVLREYAAYRIYNVITPESLKVRLARITYVDGDQVVASRPGFFIEDADDAARRLGSKEVDIGSIPSSALEPEDAARFALFQYMIGNTDWAMITGPDPADCCHNAKLLGERKDARASLTPVPYDFDNSGLVGAPYAAPNPILKVKSIKTRVYRGFCRHNSHVQATSDRFRALWPAIEAEIRAVPDLDARSVQTMLNYLGGFYRDVEDRGAVERNILGRCR